MIDEIAMAVLYGAGGGAGQTAATALWERLRERFRSDAEIVQVLAARESANDSGVAALGAALRDEVARDPAFGRELSDWWDAHRQGVQVPGIQGSYGLNVIRGNFSASVTVTVNNGATERE